MHSTKIEKVQILPPTCHRARGKRKAWRRGRTRGEIIALGSANEGQSKTRMSDGGGEESAWNAHPRSRWGWVGLGWRGHTPRLKVGTGATGFPVCLEAECLNPPTGSAAQPGPPAVLRLLPDPPGFQIRSFRSGFSRRAQPESVFYFSHSKATRNGDDACWETVLFAYIISCDGNKHSR